MAALGDARVAPNVPVTPVLGVDVCRSDGPRAMRRAGNAAAKTTCSGAAASRKVAREPTSCFRGRGLERAGLLKQMGSASDDVDDHLGGTW